MVIDFHSHTFLSDGVLVLSEHVRRAWVRGYRALAVTDHADASNLGFLLERLVPACADLNSVWPVTALPGVELTHVPPQHVAKLVEQARRLGARVVLVHGETPVEPVLAGTNRAAIEARVDVLAHPGLISAEDAARAAELGVALELTVRRGHCLGNGRVAEAARRAGAGLVIDSDAHEPGDFLSPEMHRAVAVGAGLDEAEYAAACRCAERLLDRVKEGA